MTNPIQFQVLPNPTMHSIEFNGINSNEKIKFYNHINRWTTNETVYINANSLNVSDLNSGYYFIQIKNNFF
jgi:Fe-S cluster biosynthesis and repair protein YggX